jgi:hypothetical protein
MCAEQDSLSSRKNRDIQVYLQVKAILQFVINMIPRSSQRKRESKIVFLVETGGYKNTQLFVLHRSAQNPLSSKRRRRSRAKRI